MRWIRDRRHESPESLYGYSEGTLETPATQRVGAHLAGCPACSERVREFRRLQEAVASREPEPGAGRLRAAIAGALARKEAAETAAPRRGLGGREDTMENAGTRDTARRGAYSRRSFWKVAVPLAAAVCFGALAGVWVTQDKDSSAADTAYTFYEQAHQAYKAGRREDAVRLIEKGLQGRLQLSEDYDHVDRQFKKLAVLRDLARKNRQYALDLAYNGRKAEALRVNGLNRGIGDQLLAHNWLLYGLVGVALHKIAGAVQPELLNAAGDGAAAKAAEAAYQAKVAHDNLEIRPKLEAHTRIDIENAGPFGRWKAAREEARLMREMRKAWKSG